MLVCRHKHIDEYEEVAVTSIYVQETLISSEGKGSESTITCETEKWAKVFQIAC